MWRGMNDEVIAHMRSRIAQVRKVIALAHDQRMIDALEQVIADAEADIERLEADQAQQDMPPPAQH